MQRFNEQIFTDNCSKKQVFTDNCNKRELELQERATSPAALCTRVHPLVPSTAQRSALNVKRNSSIDVPQICRSFINRITVTALEHEHSMAEQQRQLQRAYLQDLPDVRPNLQPSVSVP
jgi:hypothetical protein